MAACASTAAAQAPVGKGSLGGTIGAPFVTADSVTAAGQSPRLNLQGTFQYVMTPRTRIAASFGYGWVAYKEGTLAPYKVVGPTTPDSTEFRDLMLTKFIPIELTLIHAFKDQGKGWVPYLGLGASLTEIQIVNDLDKIKDPVTYETYVNWAPGVHARAGTEYFLPSNKNVAFDWNAHWSYLFSKDEERFPSGFTGPHSYLTINFGVNVYFWPIGYKPIEVQQAPAAEAPAAAPSEPGLPPPPAPTPPETPSAPDTTKAPPAPQSHSSAAGTRVEAATPATPVPAATVLAAEDSSAASCPVPPTSGASGSGGGMFGIPGPRPAGDGAPARSPQPDASPEERPTP
jgi:hypothetical protein